MVTIAIPAIAAVTAHPGMLNYVEGKASIGQQLSEFAIGGRRFGEPGQTITTGNGKVEILPTPGVFLRLNNDSAVTLLSANLAGTRVEVLHGQAMLEADDLHKENNLRVLDRGATTIVEKNGLYRFDANRPLVAVYAGHADVTESDKTVDMKAGHSASLDTVPLKSKKFDKTATEDELYNWSKLRSGYLAEANAASAPRLLVAGGGWFGPGWYWNPMFSSYTFIPGNGFLFSPFGLGFGSPWAYGGHDGPVYYGHSRVVTRSPAAVRPIAGIRGSSAAPRASSGMHR